MKIFFNLTIFLCCLLLIDIICMFSPNNDSKNFGWHLIWIENRNLVQ
jgi:hypothetical protein